MKLAYVDLLYNKYPIMQHGMVTTDYGFSTARRGWPVAPDGEDPLQQSSSSVVTTCSLGSRSSADRITTDCCRLGNQVSHATWRGECSNRRTELPTYSRWCSFSIGLPLYDAPLFSVYSWFNSPCKQSWTLMQAYVLFVVHCNALWYTTAVVVLFI